MKINNKEREVIDSIIDIFRRENLSRPIVTLDTKASGSPYTASNISVVNNIIVEWTNIKFIEDLYDIQFVCNYIPEVLKSACNISVEKTYSRSGSDSYKETFTISGEEQNA